MKKNIFSVIITALTVSQCCPYSNFVFCDGANVYKNQQSFDADRICSEFRSEC